MPRLAILNMQINIRKNEQNLQKLCNNVIMPFQWGRERDCSVADGAAEQRDLHQRVRDVALPRRHEHRPLPLPRRLQPRNLPRGQEGQQREGAAHQER